MPQYFHKMNSFCPCLKQDFKLDCQISPLNIEIEFRFEVGLISNDMFDAELQCELRSVSEIIIFNSSDLKQNLGVDLGRLWAECDFEFDDSQIIDLHLMILRSLICIRATAIRFSEGEP